MADEPGRCVVPGCGHAASMHNSLGYCRSRTTADRSGSCICATYDDGRTLELRAAAAEGAPQ